MAEIIENKKGFLVIKTSLTEIANIGGLGICDECNKASFVGYLVCVLNHWMCQDCYDQWSKRAKYYPEDSAIEQRNYNRYMKVFNLA